MTHITIPKIITTIIAICLICTCIAPALAENKQNTELNDNIANWAIKYLKNNDKFIQKETNIEQFNEPVYITISNNNKIEQFTTEERYDKNEILLPTKSPWHIIWNPDETFGINTIIIVAEPTLTEKGNITIYTPINQENSIFRNLPSLELLQTAEFVVSPTKNIQNTQTNTIYRLKTKNLEQIKNNPTECIYKIGTVTHPINKIFEYSFSSSTNSVI